MAVFGFRRLATAFVALLGASALAACEPPPPAPLFVVTSGSDLPDEAPGDGSCSSASGCTLRAAIQEAEAVPGPARIAFAPGVAVTAAMPYQPLPPITQSLSIDGSGGRVPHQLVHQGGTLELTDLDLASLDSCGATAPGKNLVLRRVRPLEPTGSEPAALGFCSTSATVVAESHLRSLRIQGAAPLAVKDARIEWFEAPHAQGRVVASTTSGSQVGPAVAFTGSIVTTCGLFTSNGHNLLRSGCAAAIETDIVGYDPTTIAFASPALDAIAPGTPELCVGERRDHRGVARPFGHGCDIGSLESTIPFRFGERQNYIGDGGLAALDVNDDGVAVGVVPSGGAARWLTTSGEVELLGMSGRPVAVNATGAVAGWMATGTGGSDAFRWDPDGVTMLTGLGGDGERAVDLNDQGETVGWATTSEGVRQAVLWSVDGSATVLGSEGREAWATAVNDTGAVVGGWRDASGVERAVAWDTATGASTILPGSATRANDVNDAGVVAGYASTGQGAGPVVWDPGGAGPVLLPASGSIGDAPLGAQATRILEDGSVVVTRVGAVATGPNVQDFTLVPADRSQMLTLGFSFSYPGMPSAPAPLLAISPGGRHLVWADQCYECGSHILGHLALVPMS